MRQGVRAAVLGFALSAVLAAPAAKADPIKFGVTYPNPSPLKVTEMRFHSVLGETVSGTFTIRNISDIDITAPEYGAGWGFGSTGIRNVPGEPAEAGCRTSLAPGESCDGRLRFTPAYPGRFLGQFCAFTYPIPLCADVLGHVNQP